MAGIRTHILTTRPSEHKSNALDCSAMSNLNFDEHSSAQLLLLDIFILMQEYN